MFLKNQKLVFLIPIFVLMFMFTFAFQNCEMDEILQSQSQIGSGSGSGKSDKTIDGPDGPTDVSRPGPSPLGDHAVFRLSKKYGGDVPKSNISWRIYNEECGYKSHVTFQTGLYIQIPWDLTNTVIPSVLSSVTTLNPVTKMTFMEIGDRPDPDLDVISIANLNLEALIQLEQCLIYRPFNPKTLPAALVGVVPGVGGVGGTEEKFSSSSPSSCSPSYDGIFFSLFGDASDASLDNRNYFPVGSAVHLQYSPPVTILSKEKALENKPFIWSITKFGDGIELADQAHTSSTLTHTFSEMGLYNVSLQYSGTDDADDSHYFSSVERELLIGLCEKEVDAVEVVLGEESFGESTPKAVLNSGPIFNYVRPADTNTQNKVTLVFDDNYNEHQDQHIIYKYKRNSSSSFIDIDIQNADECFLDTDPPTICLPDPGDQSDPGRPSAIINVDVDDSCFSTYGMRKSLSPLPSCSGNALALDISALDTDTTDISALDTDTTQCTDEVFVVAASKKGQEKKVQQNFYKHCPANEDYCYFGYQGDASSNHSYRPKGYECDLVKTGVR